MCEYFSYELLLDDSRISKGTLKLQVGGVYTLLIAEENGVYVSKDPLFFYNSNIQTIDHLFSVRATNASHV
jgi:hypothetical protein